MLTLPSTLVPAPPDAGSASVPSRVRCPSSNGGFIVGRLSTAPYVAAVLRRVLLMEQQVPSPVMSGWNNVSDDLHVAPPPHI